VKNDKQKYKKKIVGIVQELMDYFPDTKFYFSIEIGRYKTRKK
jgi:hypothetical protein